MKFHVNVKKGFTLVELIVVIAIIAILAAVSIVGFQSYIGRARTSNDVSDARNMTSVLQNYMTLNDLEDVDAAEIRSIVNIDNDYSFVPRVDGYSFWYNETSRTIELKSSYEIMFEEDDFTELTGTIATRLLNDQALDAPSVGDKLEEVVDGFYLLDRGGSDFADAINGIRNLKTLSDFDDAVSALVDYGTIQTHVDTFHPDDTLFINDFFGLTSSGNEDVTKVIFADGIEAIPGAALASVTTLPSEIKLPISVSVIEQGAFTQMTSDTKIEYRDLSVIQVESDAFRADDVLNLSLREKEGTVQLEDLEFIITYSNDIERLYIYPTQEFVATRIDNDGTYTYYDVEGSTVTVESEIEILRQKFEDLSYDDGTGVVSYMVVSNKEANIRLALDVDSGEPVYGFHMTFREHNGLLIAEAKAYNQNGQLFARGTISTMKYVHTLLRIPE
jgi:prepilin-type N-terminal cleavage/methylation domain-containing protein